MKREKFLPLLTYGGLLWFFFFLHSCTAGDPRNPLPPAREVRPSPAVQVGIGTAIRVEEATFTVRGPCRIGGRETPALEAKVTVDGDGLRVGPHTFDARVVRVEVERDGDLEINGKPYHGEIIIFRDRGKVTLVNEVRLEHYVPGVLGREMSLSRGREALKAQVIAARTYALCEIKGGRLRKGRGEKFDLYDDQRSQVYGGIRAESTLALDIARETRGMFVVWNGGLVHTFYSSTCGGATDPAWNMLGEGVQVPPLGGTECGFCEKSPHYEWEKAFTRREMAEKLFANEPNLRVKSARVSKAMKGGHAEKVEVTLESHAGVRALHANREFRRRLRLKSSLITSIEESGDQIVIRGRGWGHGAGMCQWGAYGMAAAGRAAIEILEHYFPGATVQKLY